MDKLTDKQLITILTEASNAYYNTDTKIMSDDEFEWWNEIVEKLNKINDLETELSEEKFAEYEEEDFDSADLETEVNARLEWLESVA